MKKELFNDKIGYVTDEVSTIKTCEANLNEDNRMKFVTDLAAISRGKSESNNPRSRYEKLLREAAPTAYTIANDIKVHTNNGMKYMGSPSRPMEFLPVKLLMTTDKCYDIFNTNGDYLWEFSDIVRAQELLRFSHVEVTPFGIENGYPEKLAHTISYTVYTNMRACINAGIPYNKIPYNTAEELKGFVALKAKIPMYSWAQAPNTHTLISSEAVSDRFKTIGEYWMPEDFRDRVYEYSLKHAYHHKTFEQQEIMDTDDTGRSSLNGSYPSEIYRKITDEVLGIRDSKQIPYFLINGSIKTDTSPTQNDVQMYFKELGYPAEIYQRAMYYMKYKEVIMTGWKTDPKVWDHLFIERSVEPDIWDNWTQSETKVFIKAIKEIIKGE